MAVAVLENKLVQLRPLTLSKLMLGNDTDLVYVKKGAREGGQRRRMGREIEARKRRIKARGR